MFEQIALGNIDVIDSLIKGGVPIDITDGSKANDTPFHWACSFGNCDVVKYLLCEGYDIDHKNGDGQTGLHIACKNGHIDVVKLLLLEGCDQSIEDNNNKKPISLLKQHKDEIEILLKNPPIPTLEHRKIFESRHLNTTNRLQDTTPSTTEVTNHTSESHTIKNDIVYYENRFGDVEYERGYLDDIYNSSSTVESPLLVLWPPVQRQRRHDAIPLLLHSHEVVIVSMFSNDVDAFLLLSSSGFLEVLEKFGLHTKIMRSSSKAKIKLCIDNSICCGRHRYEIRIHPHLATLIASDVTGLMYALQSFVQILHLHSEIRVRDKVTYVYLPPVEIQDWPDIPDRAVLWSLHKNVQFHTQNLKDMIQLFSRLRINKVLTILDMDKVGINSLHVDNVRMIFYCSYRMISYEVIIILI
jgi:hypothetical protein